METNLQIKNVVCQRCVTTVREILERSGIAFESVSLGEAVLKKPLEPADRKKLNKEFRKVGFEILESRNEKIVNKMKSIIIEEVYGDNEEFGGKKLSEILSNILGYDYSYLSGLFSQMESTNISKYHSKLQIERAEELLEYGELNINEIAQKLGYSDASYFCTKFKKATGYTPITYQKKHLKKRKGLENL